MKDTQIKPKSPSERLDILEKENSELQKQLIFEKYKIDTLQTQMGNSNGNIANLLSIFSVMAAVCLVIFGIYIQRMFNKITEASKLAQDTHGQIQQIRKDIDDNFRKIYDSIINEELNEILQRLSEVPEDIVHYSSFFLGKQNLPRDIFEELAILVLKSQERPMTELARSQSAGKYFSIILQHYPRRAFENEELWSVIAPNLRDQLNSFYHKDMLNFIAAIFDNRHPDWFTQNESKLLWLFGSWFYSPFASDLYLKELHVYAKSNISEIEAILAKEPKYKWFFDKLTEVGKEHTQT